jgi:hypothetical protein
MLASGLAEYDRFRESAFRHFMLWYLGHVDEDHAAAVFFNINGAEYVLRGMKDDLNEAVQACRKAKDDARQGSLSVSEPPPSACEPDHYGDRWECGGFGAQCFCPHPDPLPTSDCGVCGDPGCPYPERGPEPTLCPCGDIEGICDGKGRCIPWMPS